jgi:hypothetical protein
MCPRSFAFGFDIDKNTSGETLLSACLYGMTFNPKLLITILSLGVSSQVTILSGRSISQSSGSINRLGYRVTA